MKQKRDNIFIWVTWLTGLISGDKQCEYASWFKAHYQYDKTPGDFNLCKWNIKHNQLLHKRRDELKEEGYVVMIEDQNKFKLELILPLGLDREKEGWQTLPIRKVTVSGKVDLVALAGSNTCLRSLLEDCKTGRPKNSDQVQVMLYIMFLSECIKKYKDIHFDGCVVYNDSKIPIFWADVDADLKEVVWGLINRVAGDEPCRKTPSYGECEWCDISKEDCPERME